MSTDDSKKLLKLLKSDIFVEEMMRLKTYQGGINLLKEHGIQVTLEELMFRMDISLARMFEYGFVPKEE